MNRKAIVLCVFIELLIILGAFIVWILKDLNGWLIIRNISVPIIVVPAGILSVRKIIKNSPVKIDNDQKEEIVKEVKKGVKTAIQETNKTPNIHYHYPAEKTKTPKALTVKMPKIGQERIVGREAELDDLHKRLFDNRQVVLVNGLGGIGKTILAQVYTAKYWDEYCHIAWISQLSENIINNFINTEGLLDVLKIQSEGKKSEELFINIITELKKIDDKPNLLIIDNADTNLSKWYYYLPSQPLWHILVTSREQIQHFDLKELGFLSGNDAIDLFLSHYTHGKINKEEIEKLVEAVDLHTLTIEILAKTAQKQRTEIKQLKEAIENDLKANVYVDHKGDKVGKITSYLSSIFTMSKLSNNGIWVLKQFVCLPPEFHSYELVKELIKPEESQKEDIFSETIEELSAKGWLLKNQETDSYKMHRIIADVIKQQQTIALSDVEFIINSVAEKLEIDQTRDNPVDKFQWIPYGKSVLDIFPASTDTKISELQNNLLSVLEDLGDYEGAKEILEKILRSDEKKFGPDHTTTVINYSNLATALEDLGDYESAKESLEKALSSAKNFFGPENLSTAWICFNLATVLKELGDYERAKELLEKALPSFEKTLGPYNLYSAKICSNLGLVLKELGDYEGAKEILEKAQRSLEKKSGTEHASVEHYSVLANTLKELGDYKGAKELLEKALFSFGEDLNAEYAVTAQRCFDLALMLKELGDYEGAKELLEKILPSLEKNFGAEHPTTVEIYSNLADALIALGDYERALKLSEKSVSIFKSFTQRTPKD